MCSDNETHQGAALQAGNPQSTSRKSLSYDRLRAWYLAGLRRRIVSKMGRQSFTPSTLIQADVQALQDLILNSALPVSRMPTKELPKKFLVVSAVPLLFAIPVLLVATFTTEHAVLIVVTLLSALLAAALVHLQWKAEWSFQLFGLLCRSNR